MDTLQSNATGLTQPIRIFYAYSHKDEALRNELETHLSILKRRGVVSQWHDRRILSGKDWGGEIDRHLNGADIILLLVSADFIASDYCYDKEMKRALERHESGEARVIPVILRPCDFDGAPFYKLQGLPKDMKPVTRWLNQDEAFTDIAVGIRKAAEELRAATKNEMRKVHAVQVPHTTLQHRSPRRDPYGLHQWGARLEIEVGRPTVRATSGLLLPSHQTSGLPTFSRMPALIDTGARSTLLTPAAVKRLGLTQVDQISVARAGGITDQVGMYVASIQFPRQKLATIEAIKVVCCELPEQPIQCLIGRDILSRWTFTYSGSAGGWVIEEEDVAPWIEPTSEVDM